MVGILFLTSLKIESAVGWVFAFLNSSRIVFLCFEVLLKICLSILSIITLITNYILTEILILSSIILRSLKKSCFVIMRSVQRVISLSFAFQSLKERLIHLLSCPNGQSGLQFWGNSGQFWGAILGNSGQFWGNSGDNSGDTLLNYSFLTLWAWFLSLQDPAS